MTTPSTRYEVGREEGKHGETWRAEYRFAGLADAMALAEERGMDVYDTGADIFLRREDLK